MKYLIPFLLMCVTSICGFSQLSSQIQAKRGVFTERLYLNGKWIDRISTDLNTTDSASDDIMATAKAVADYVRSRSLSNAESTGDTLINDSIVKRLKTGYGITFSTNADQITIGADTIGANSLVTKSQLRDTTSAIRAKPPINLASSPLTATGNFVHDWNSRRFTINNIVRLSINSIGSGIGLGQVDYSWQCSDDYAVGALFRASSATSGLLSQLGMYTHSIYGNVLELSHTNNTGGHTSSMMLRNGLIHFLGDSIVMAPTIIPTVYSADTLVAIRGTGLRTLVKIPANALSGGSGNWSINGNDIYNNNIGNVGIGITSPTAAIDIKAGTTTLAPFGLNAGSLLSMPSNGKMEYDGTNLYFTVSGTRKIVQLGTTTGTIYVTDGTISGPRTITGDNYPVTWDSVGLFRIKQGNTTVGATFDFNSGVDHLVYNASNSSNLIMNAVSGLRFQYVNVPASTTISSLDVNGSGIKLTGVQEYADNSAAVAAGLPIGYIYRTGDVLKIVH
jgi:hypothetical protein